MKKNSKADVWKFVAERYHSRTLAGRRTLVELRGEIIPDGKVRKAIGLYGYQTTAERLAYRPRSQTPPDVRLFTPSSSPSPMQEFVDSQQVCSLIRRPVQRSWTDDDFFTLAEATPWHQFIVSIQSLSTGSGDLLVLPPQHNADSVTIFPGGTDGPETTEVARCSQFSKWFENMLYAMYTPDILEEYFHPACLTPASFLPPSRDTDSKIDINAVLDLSTRSTQLEFLKYAVNLISNNFSNSHISSAVVELLREKQNRSLLQTLIDQNLIIASAFLDNLWAPALSDVNLELLTMILDGGYDINRKSDFTGWSIGVPRSGLQYAIEEEADELVEFLLRKGASVNESGVISYPRDKLWSFKTLLELAAMWGRFGLVHKLIAPWPQHDTRAPKMTINVLRQAVSYGQLDCFHVFLDYAPHLHAEIHTKSWILLEAAAAQKNHQVFTAILEYLDIQGFNSETEGSILAAAYISQDFDRVKMLHQMGANVNSVAVGVKMKYQPRFYKLDMIDYGLYKIQGMSALHLATDACDESAVAFLIMNGANVNQRCQNLLPLQIAVFKGSEVIVDLLLKAGADLITLFDETVEVPYMLDGLHLAAGRPVIQIALESGHLPVFERIFGRGIKDMSYQVPFSDSQLILWAIEGGNSELVERVIHGFMATGKISPHALADCVSEFGCCKGFDLISQVECLDQTAIYSVEVLCAIVSHHNLDCLQNFLTNASKIRGALPEKELTVAMALACNLAYFDLLDIFLETLANPYVTPSINVPRKLLRNSYQRALRSAIEESLSIQELPLKTLDTLLKFSKRYEHDPAAEGPRETVLYESCCRAIRYQSNLGILSRLLAEGLDVNWMPLRGQSLLQYAVSIERVGMAEFLLSSNADPNAPAVSFITSSTCTALQLAAQLPDQELFDLLLQKGANPSAPPTLSYGATATQYAAMSGNFAFLDTLLKLGMDINEPPGDHKGRTAIEGAAEHGCLDMVCYLLEAGANVKGKTNINYRRTVYRAWSEGHRAIVQLIQNWKSRQYGREDCEFLDTIVETMTTDELDFESPAAKIRYIGWVKSIRKNSHAEVEMDQRSREEIFQKTKRHSASLIFNREN